MPHVDDAKSWSFRPIRRLFIGGEHAPNQQACVSVPWILSENQQDMNELVSTNLFYAIQLCGNSDRYCALHWSLCESFFSIQDEYVRDKLLACLKRSRHFKENSFKYKIWSALSTHMKTLPTLREQTSSISMDFGVGSFQFNSTKIYTKINVFLLPVKQNGLRLSSKQCLWLQSSSTISNYGPTWTSND